MIRHGLLFLLVLGVAAGTATAEPSRTLLTRENKFPEIRQLELDVRGSFIEYVDNNEQFGQTDANQYVLTPGVRYQVAQDLALIANLPVGRFEPDGGSNESGLGNLALGLQLRAHEDFFRYPYVIPHITVKLNTAKEEVHIDTEENSAIFGLTVGSFAWEAWTFNLDGSYEFFEDSENLAALAASVVWDINTRFAVLFEARMTDEDTSKDGDSDNPVLFVGGLSYEIDDRSTIMIYGGSESDSTVDVFGTLRYVYTFF